jgi:hypothetical protein
MLEILKPPTDNVYKCFAFLGLFFLMLSIGGPLWLQRQLHHNIVGLSKDANLWVLEVKDARNLSDRIAAEFKALDIKPLENDLVTISEKAKELEHQAQALYDKALGTRRREIEIVNKLDLIQNDEQWLRKVGLYGFLGMIISGNLTVLGFIGWYRRTQRFQDSILKDASSRSNDSKPIILTDAE